MALRRFVFRLARTRAAGWFLRQIFAHMSFLLPLQRLRETRTLLAFHHPQPSYPLHILIVPRRDYGSLMDVSPQDGEFQRDLFETVQSLVREFGLEATGYRLIANGGAYQDTPILHFHLIAEQYAEAGRT